MVDQGTISRKLQLQRTKTGADTPTGASDTGATWTEIWSAASQTSASKTNGSTATIENYRNIIDADYISAGATTIRVKFEASTGGMTIEGCAIGKQDPTYPFRYVEPPTATRFKYGGADISEANPIVLGSNESAYSDSLTFTIDETVNYLIHIWNGDGFSNYGKWTDGITTSSGYSTGATDHSLTVVYTGTGSAIFAGISSIEKYE